MLVIHLHLNEQDGMYLDLTNQEPKQYHQSMKSIRHPLNIPGCALYFCTLVWVVFKLSENWEPCDRTF